jgi:hypothetical protein
MNKIMPQSGTDELYSTAFTVYIKIAEQFSRMSAQCFHTFPPVRHERPSLSTLSRAFGIVTMFYFSYSDMCVVVVSICISLVVMLNVFSCTYFSSIYPDQ